MQTMAMSLVEDLEKICRASAVIFSLTMYPHMMEDNFLET